MSSLYLGSASVLLQFLRDKSPLTQLIYSSHELPEKQRKAGYALTLGTLRYKHVLDQLLEQTNFMKLDRKMNRAVVLVMLYDLLLGSTQSIQGGGSVKKLILSQENKLRTQWARMKITAGVREDEELLPKEIRFTSRLPRYARVNTLRATVASVLEELKKEDFLLQNKKFDHRHVNWTAGSEKHVYLDAHIPSLLVFHPATDLHDHALLHSGRVILQDKASCMTAAVLDPKPSGDLATAKQPFHVLDACAAPGNKTTHLLAIAMEHLRKSSPAASHAFPPQTVQPSASTPTAASSSSSSPAPAPAPSSQKRPRSSRTGEDDENDSAVLTTGSSSNRATGQKVTFQVGPASSKPLVKLEACEVDPTRFQLLQKMMVRALPQHRVVSGTLAKTAVLPDDVPDSLTSLSCPPCSVTLRNQSFLDLSPSSPEFSTVGAILLDPTCSGSGMGHRIEQFYKHRVVDGDTTGVGKKHIHTSALNTRVLSPGQEKAEVMTNVAALAEFQKQILSHALSFPQVDVVAYSTCSIHAAEDESVVQDVLLKHPEFTLAPALPTWSRRGVKGDTELSDKLARTCGRSNGAEDGMNGFFVAKFVRKGSEAAAAVNGNANGSLHHQSQTSKTKQKHSTMTKSSSVQSASSSVAAPSPKLTGQKRAREADSSDQHDDDDDADAAEDLDANEGEDDAEDVNIVDASTASTTASAGAIALGKQTLRNKKKREKAKRRKLEESANKSK